MPYGVQEPKRTVTGASELAFSWLNWELAWAVLINNCHLKSTGTVPARVRGCQILTCCQWKLQIEQRVLISLKTKQTLTETNHKTTNFIKLNSFSGAKRNIKRKPTTYAHVTPQQPNRVKDKVLFNRESYLRFWKMFPRPIPRPLPLAATEKKERDQSGWEFSQYGQSLASALGGTWKATWTNITLMTTSHRGWGRKRSGCWHWHLVAGW